jgi:hypothetical protein
MQQTHGTKNRFPASLHGKPQNQDLARLSENYASELMFETTKRGSQIELISVKLFRDEKIGHAFY